MWECGQEYVSYLRICTRVHTYTAFVCAHGLCTGLAPCHRRIFRLALNLTHCPMHLEPVRHDSGAGEGNVEAIGLVLGDLCSGGERGSVIPSGTT